MRDAQVYTYRPPHKRGWIEALTMYYVDKNRSKLLKFLFAYGPFAIVNDVMFPIVGTVDDPYIPLWALIVLPIINRKVRKYR